MHLVTGKQSGILIHGDLQPDASMRCPVTRPAPSVSKAALAPLLSSGRHLDRHVDVPRTTVAAG
jgi:hypothetical protein